jgi:hypothetical protein
MITLAAGVLQQMFLNAKLQTAGPRAVPSNGMPLECYRSHQKNVESMKELFVRVCGLRGRRDSCLFPHDIGTTHDQRQGVPRTLCQRFSESIHQGCRSRWCSPWIILRKEQQAVPKFGTVLKTQLSEVTVL